MKRTVTESDEAASVQVTFTPIIRIPDPLASYTKSTASIYTRAHAQEVLEFAD